MKIMVLSNNAWDDRDASNTFSNLFSEWYGAEFSNVFHRDAEPNNQICEEYFRISDKMLLKHFFTPSKIGYRFSSSDIKKAEPVAVNKSNDNEKKLISVIHRYNLGLAYTVENFLWRAKGWQSSKFKNFLSEMNPDIIFTFAIPSIQRLLMLRFLKQNTNAKIVLFLVDNVCAKYLSGDGKEGLKEFQRLKEMFKLSEKNYGISEELRKIYGSKFGVDIAPLYKGCDFSTPVKTSAGNPVRIVYAGNLLYRRLDTLISLAKALKNINGNTQKYFLEVYSGTDISDKEKQSLNILETSQFCGSRSYDEIKEILSAADMVLHVESFEEDQIENVKYSFSTKITDCLQSGSVLTVIGPKGISSVEYSRHIPGAIVIDDTDQIQATFSELTIDSLPERACAIREFAVKYHSIDAAHKSLQEDFNSLVGG